MYQFSLFFFASTVAGASDRDRSRVLDCVSKMCRALQTSGWEKDAKAVDSLASASTKLVELYLQVLSFPPTMDLR